MLRRCGEGRDGSSLSGRQAKRSRWLPVAVRFVARDGREGRAEAELGSWLAEVRRMLQGCVGVAAMDSRLFVRAEGRTERASARVPAYSPHSR